MGWQDWLGILEELIMMGSTWAKKLARRGTSTSSCAVLGREMEAQQSSQQLGLSLSGSQTATEL
jgi:hypothetical protein